MSSILLSTISEYRTIILATFSETLLLTLIFRYHWVQTQIKLSHIDIAHFIMFHSRTLEQIAALTERWPAYHLYLEIWNWDFSRYHVYPDLYEEVEEFARTSLKNPRLDLEIYQKIQKGEIRTDGMAAEDMAEMEQEILEAQGNSPENNANENQEKD